MPMTGFVPTANIKRLSASLEKIVSAYFVSQRDKMNISVSAAQSVSQSVQCSGFVLPGTEHFPGILQVKVKANMRSRFFSSIALIDNI